MSTSDQYLTSPLQEKSQNLLSSIQYHRGSRESLNSDDSFATDDMGETFIGGNLIQGNNTINYSAINVDKA